MSDLNDRLQPYVIALPEMAEDLLLGSPFEDVSCYDPLDAADQRFFRLVTAGNAVAFGPMAMPLRVLLEHCALPGALFGFALPRSAMPPGVWASLVARFRELFGFQLTNPIEDYVGYVPVSEYAAIASPDGTTVARVAAYTLVEHAGLEVRSRAFALSCLKAVREIGVAEYDDPALPTHCALGPLALRAARAVNHSHPERAFVYELTVPSPERLAAVALGDRAPLPPLPPDPVHVPLGDETGAAVRRLLEGRPGLRILPPGRIERAGMLQIVLG